MVVVAFTEIVSFEQPFCLVDTELTVHEPAVVLAAEGFRALPASEMA